MANTTLDRDIRSRIDAFLEELTSLVKQTALNSVHAALGEGAAPSPRSSGRRRMQLKLDRLANVSMSGAKRSTAEVGEMAERIAAFVRSNPGARLEAIAAGLGTPSKELKLPVIKLLSSKTLTKKGEKRGTMYFVGGRSNKAKRGRK